MLENNKWLLSKYINSYTALVIHNTLFESNEVHLKKDKTKFEIIVSVLKGTWKYC